MARNRVFLTGSERAEFEHIYGALPVDDTDPRFVLVTPEEEARIRQLPAGVPVRPAQDPGSIAKIQAHFEKAAELAGKPFQSDTAGIKADPTAFDAPVAVSGDNESDNEDTTRSAAVSGNEGVDGATTANDTSTNEVAGGGNVEDAQSE
jgi:hypothetical protein